MLGFFFPFLPLQSLSFLFLFFIQSHGPSSIFFLSTSQFLHGQRHTYWGATTTSITRLTNGISPAITRITSSTTLAYPDAGHTTTTATPTAATSGQTGQ
jgi:hypothetical protein